MGEVQGGVPGTRRSVGNRIHHHTLSGPQQVRRAGRSRFLVRAVSLAAQATRLPALVRARRRRGAGRLHILAYHDVSRGGRFEGQVGLLNFRSQLRGLAENYRFVDLVAGAGDLAGGTPAHRGREAVTLTFDDGYRGNHALAWPEIEACDGTATFFLTTGFLDGAPLWFDTVRRALRGWASADPAAQSRISQAFRAALGEVDRPAWGTEAVLEQLKRLAPAIRQQLATDLASHVDHVAAAEPMTWAEAGDLKARGAALGAHTVTHPILAQLGDSEQRREIAGAAERIEEQLGVRVRSFAYPNGTRLDLSESTVGIVRELGFDAACTMVRGSNRAHADPLRLRRIGVGDEPWYVLDTRMAGLFDQEVRDRLGGTRAWRQ